MRFTRQFLEVFLQDFLGLAPLILTLLFFIAFMGIVVGKLERWSFVDSLYLAFITATTVGYGEIVPTRPLSKTLCIIIALVGLLLTGIIVAAGVHAVDEAYQQGL
jgi:hypothetical protein